MLSLADVPLPSGGIIMNKPFLPNSATWLSSSTCSVENFAAEVGQKAAHEDYPRAAEIRQNVPIYDADDIRAKIGDKSALQAFMAEWNAVLLEGPGVLAFKRAFSDTSVVDEVTQILNRLIEAERAIKGDKGDHFAKAGANARLWNSHEKLCAAAPELFARYNSNDIVALISRSWLGPLYQVTAQVNLVYPGGQAQSPHRDYHMGFQTDEQLEQYPAHVHRLSAALTLQGAVAHCDMPIESGPTKLLPYSQRYLPGYFATHNSAFKGYFENHFVQIPLQKGDALFFNPALFHAAGTNRSKDVARFANLLQIGSGYGRSIEVVDRARMSKILYPVLKRMRAGEEFGPRLIENVISACAEGYPFPANLDLDSPASGMAPPSQQDILRQALRENWDADRFDRAVDSYVARRSSH